MTNKRMFPFARPICIAAALAIIPTTVSCGIPAPSTLPESSAAVQQESAVSTEPETTSVTEPLTPTITAAESYEGLFGPVTLPLKPGDNVYLLALDYYQVVQPQDYNDYDLRFLTFFDTTTFVGCEKEAAELIEGGKNPGLGVRGLHNKGITGNVRVAIIDQNMVQGNPELGDRVVAYKDFGTNAPDNTGSMHGLSVASILAGKTVGVAPDAKIYYVAVPGWNQEAKDYANALNWIIEENEKLPADDKIKVVSVSASPSVNFFKNGDLWSEAVVKARDAGIFVIDCRGEDKTTGFVFGAYHDRNDPDNIEKSHPGYICNDGRDYNNPFWQRYLFAPSGEKTIAEELIKGERHFRYDGFGGQSWSVPYVAGVAAMGYQVNPDMTPEQCRELLFSTAWVDSMGLSFVNPPAFVEAAEKLKTAK